MAQTNRRFINERLRNFIETSRGKTYTVAVVTGVLVLVLFTFGVFPSVRAIIRQVGQNEARIETLQKIEEKNQRLRQLANEIENKSNVSEALNQSLPDNIQQETVIDTVTKLARKNNVSFSSVQFSRGGNANNSEYNKEYIGEAGINLKVVGSRTDVVQFAEDMEESIRVFNLSQLSLGRRTADGPTHALSIQADYYYWAITEAELMQKYRPRSSKPTGAKQNTKQQNQQPNQQLDVEDVVN